MTQGREDKLWGLDGGCGAHITKWRVRKPKRIVFEVKRTFDKQMFTFICESYSYLHLLSKQNIGDHLILEGMPLRRRRYQGHTNIMLIRATPTGLSFQVE